MSGQPHDSRCEREYTENGFIFIDCLCHIRRAKAEAWDEGFTRGFYDTLAGGSHDASESAAKNPYADEVQP